MPDTSALRAALLAEEEFAPVPAGVAAEVTARLRRQHRRRRHGSLVAVAAAVAVLAGGTAVIHGAGGAPPTPPAVTAVHTPTASPSTTASASTTARTSSAPAVPDRMKVSTPVFGRTDLSPVAPVIFSVANGTIVAVTVTVAGGKPLAGRISTDGASWTLTGALGYGTHYLVAGIAAARSGQQLSFRGAFATVAPKSQAHVELSPQTGTTVGIGATISLTFPAGLTPANRASVEQRLSVVTSVPVDGSWAWFQRNGGWVVDWRPKNYWAQDVSVRVSADLFGIPLAPGVYGASDLRSDFRIGRAQFVRVDGASNRLVVTRNGVTVAVYPAAVSRSGTSGGVVTSGTYVVLDKIESRVSSRPGSSDQRSVTKWVVRLSSSGELIGAPTATEQGGVVAGSDGTVVALSESDAKAYFTTVLSGDPVQVLNGGSPASAAHTDSDWSIPWADWQQLSG